MTKYNKIYDKAKVFQLHKAAAEVMKLITALIMVGCFEDKMQKSDKLRDAHKLDSCSLWSKRTIE